MKVCRNQNFLKFVNIFHSYIYTTIIDEYKFFVNTYINVIFTVNTQPKITS